MQKVHSYFYLTFTRAAYKTTISNLSFTVLYAVAYVLYLALEEGSPIVQTGFARFTFSIFLDYIYIHSH